jgi:ribose 5-phosphate isomerase B
MKIAIASDHAGFELKKYLISCMEELGLEVQDFGPLLYTEDDDYPDYVKSVGEYISENNNSCKKWCFNNIQL